MNQSKTLLILFGIVGSIMIVLSVFFYQEANNFEKNGVITRGQVVKIIEYPFSTRVRYHYAPVVEFQTKDKKTIKFISDDRVRYSHSYTVGQAVDVIYLPNVPSKAEIYSFSNIWMKPILSFFLGLVFALIGFGTVYRWKKQEKLKTMLNSVGEKIIAQVTSISEIASSKTIKCVIEAQYSEGDKNYHFTSDILAIDPGTLRELKEIEVTVDPNDYKKYTVNTENLSKTAKLKTVGAIHQPSSSIRSKSVHIIRKVSNILIFIYILSITYSNLKIDGVDYGMYFRPIATIPFFSVLIFQIVIEYILQSVENNVRITTDQVKHEIGQTITNLAKQNPLSLMKHHLWQSFKMLLKQWFIAIILVMCVLAIFQVIFGGSDSTMVTF